MWKVLHTLSQSSELRNSMHSLIFLPAAHRRHA